MTLAYLALCCAAFYSAGCRLVLTDRKTAVMVRLVFCGVGMATAFAAFSVLFWGYTPALVDVLTMGAFAAMLIVCSRRWPKGVPAEYLADDAPKPRRRSSDYVPLDVPRHTRPWGEA